MRVYMVVFLGCVLQLGDGTGGSEFRVAGNLTAFECVDACRKLKENDESINGATVTESTIPVRCYCERNMKKLAIYESCFLEGKA